MSETIETTKREKIHKTDAEWRELLTPEQFHVMRQKGTERAFSGALVNNHADGIYHCGACNAPLFKSETKFDAHCGWPSFYEPAVAEAIELVSDRSMGVTRTEVRCRRCGAISGMCSTTARSPPGSASA